MWFKEVETIVRQEATSCNRLRLIQLLMKRRFKIRQVIEKVVRSETFSITFVLRPHHASATNFIELSQKWQPLA